MQVSIIMPYFNAEKYIHETIQSIIAQTYQDWELIIINDCSTSPNSIELLNKIKTIDNRIKIIHTQRNGGAGTARNIGIRAAQGRYIGFCDSDDWWYPSKLEEQITFMQKNNYEFTCTYYEDTNEKLEPYYTMKQSEKQSYKDLILGCNIGTPGVLFDTQRIGKKYMPNLRCAEDWGLWLTILKEVDYIYTYPKALWKYRHIAGSETSNKWKQMKAVTQMYQTTLNIGAIRAWSMGLFIFLPLNILKKLRKAI